MNDPYFKTKDDLIRAARESGQHYDIDAIKAALVLAEQAHEGQKRTSGEPFVSHPISVAIILIGLGMDTDSIVAALLHDVVEDTDITLETIRKSFGVDVAMLVDGVTKLGKISYHSREEEQAENLRKMLIAMAEDIRVIIIKLSDRLHNMRTLDACPEQKRLDKAKETLEVFAPIAHRLGIRPVKEELEDLAIRQLDPIGCAEIMEALATRQADRNNFLKIIKERIQNRLKDSIPNVYLEGRVKSIHGVYRKMYMQGKSFDEIYDVYAVRIIVDTLNDCYNILGIVHDMFRPIPGRFKDYISTPKPNLYQSLHTTVIGREGIPFELQIRTWEMHHTAEYGIAAHWKYKQGIKGAGERMDQRLAWIRQLLENQKDADDVEEIVHTIKTDLAQEDVFVVSPKGDVISLPVGSTVVDFAYAIHSAVGNRMVGAKVDGRIVPIDYQVKTGEIVEVLTTQQSGHGPSRDWLKFVKTSSARNKIRTWFKKEQRPENIAVGRTELDRLFRREMMDLTDVQKQEFLEQLVKIYHCNSVEDYFATIGYGGLSITNMVPRIKEEYNKHFRKAMPPVDVNQYISGHKRGKALEGVVVEGIENCLVHLSHCCDPLPGDPIIGFITRGHGVSVHKVDCKNVPRNIAKSEHPQRWVNVHWAGVQNESFKSTLYILAVDRSSLLADITLALANMRVAIHAVNARQLKDGNCQIVITISIENTNQLQAIMARLGKVESVISVDRTRS